MSFEKNNWIERAITTEEQRKERAALLESRNLAPPGREDYILGLYEDERLVATGSIVGNTLQGIAVSEDIEGEGAASLVVSSLVKRATESGRSQLFLFTKLDDSARFEAMGFATLAGVDVKNIGGRTEEGVFERGEGVALLELDKENLPLWLKSLSTLAAGKPKNAGAVVVNCNPFTLGHLKLLEWASSRSPWLYVFVVEEDKSLFPFTVRFELVRRGVSGLRNVTLIPGGPYVISSATFPTYFVRLEKVDRQNYVSRLHAALDLEIFRRHIAPALDLSTRYVGTEPYCPTTALYNETMKHILPLERAGERAIQVQEMPRFSVGGEAVSASRVRKAIKEGKIGEAKPLLPESTWEWLNSPEAEPVIKRIELSDSRH